MDRIARLTEQDRRDVFSDAAEQLGIRRAIIEKDFWVCFALRSLFADSPYREHLVFKGGTSLSKVYQLIERFSEDIDLVLDWRLLGFGDEEPLRAQSSKTKQDRFNKRVNQIASEFIADKLCPELDALFQNTGAGLSASIDRSDPQVVNIRYPAAFSEAYIRPEVRLEIGPLASWVPSARHTIRPYAYDVLPDLFDDPNCPVLAIAAERTFWEKATILHQEAHRTGQMLGRHSRHYYDLYKLSLSPTKSAALVDLKLLRDVVEFKEQFYPSRWARYDLAVPGSFKLLPTSTEHLTDLARDYNAMGVMLFGDPPAFDLILKGLELLAVEINALNPRQE